MSDERGDRARRRAQRNSTMSDEERGDQTIQIKVKMGTHRRTLRPAGGTLRARFAAPASRERGSARRAPQRERTRRLLAAALQCARRYAGEPGRACRGGGCAASAGARADVGAFSRLLCSARGGRCRAGECAASGAEREEFARCRRCAATQRGRGSVCVRELVGGAGPTLRLRCRVWQVAMRTST